MFKRLVARVTAVHVLLLVALLEVAINRVAVPMLRPTGTTPPAWHTHLDYIGLFLFYFAGTLAVLVLVQRSWMAIRSGVDRPQRIAQVLVGLTALIAAAPLVIDAPAALTATLEVAFAASVVAIVIANFGAGRDLGLQIGLPILAAPLLLHTISVAGAKFVWPDNTFDGPGAAMAHAASIALWIAAMSTPYCLAPRPFVRAVTRPVPILVAMIVAAASAIIARTWYLAVAKAAALATGIELSTTQPDPRLALFLLAVATLAWTLISCALAASPARRAVGAGLALIILGGYAFKWPHHYLLPLLGLTLISEAARSVRDDELAAVPIASTTPPITDVAWANYMGLVSQGLRRALGELHALTSRGEAGLASSVMVGEARGRSVRLRIERIEGSVLALDVVLGRDIDEVRPATLTIWAIAPRALGVNPAGPPAAPQFRTGDASFDERFKVRGSAPAFRELFDDGLRARAIATLDGWLAFWDGESLRYRVYPGRGAPLDHPMPLSDLALGRATANADRLIAVIELLIEVASRGIAPAAAADARPAAEPTELV